jgi:NitT/TauT family transport system permease protein
MVKKLKFLLPLLAILGFLFGCQLTLTYGNVASFILPKPSQVVDSMIKNQDWIITNLKVTLHESVVGFAIGVSVGIGLALFYLFIPFLEDIIVPLAVIAKSVPFVAIAPFLFTYFGYGEKPKIIIVAIVCFFPVMFNMAAGLKQINPHQIEKFAVLKASKWQRFRMLELPSSIPLLTAGLEIAVSNTVIAAVVGELLGAMQGLGFALQMSISQYNRPLLAAIAFATTLASMFLTLGLQTFDRIVFKRWLTP